MTSRDYLEGINAAGIPRVEMREVPLRRRPWSEITTILRNLDEMGFSPEQLGLLLTDLLKAQDARREGER